MSVALKNLVKRPRVILATLPTPLERGPQLPGGVRLWIKRDDLTGLGVGGNKARKLEFLCGEAQQLGATSLITAGADQSNHCAMTAAAGARLGLETHLVLSGDKPTTLVGNQLLAARFGAHLHFSGASASHWGELEVHRDALTDELRADGLNPYSMPIGGSTPVGALGYIAGFVELMQQCEAAAVKPAAIVFASSSGGTHAGLAAGRALWRNRGHDVPEVLAVGVSKGVISGNPDIPTLANNTLSLIDERGVRGSDVVIDTRWVGDDYGLPTKAGGDAAHWAARRGGWLLDQVYTAKAFAALLANAEAGRWPKGSNVVFLHTGGIATALLPSSESRG